MSRDWTPEELQAASSAMKNAGQMGYEEFTAAVADQDAKVLIERFAKKQRDRHFPCPRCGCWNMNEDPVRNALSRRATVCICDSCGIAEALEDAVRAPSPLTIWNLVQEPNAYRMGQN